MGNLNQYYSKLLIDDRRVNETIDDILLEADDIGIKWVKNHDINQNLRKIELIGHDDRVMTAKEVKPIVYRLCDYLKQEGFNPKADFDGNHVYFSLAKLKHTVMGKVFYVKIKY